MPPALTRRAAVLTAAGSLLTVGCDDTRTSRSGPDTPSGTTPSGTTPASGSNGTRETLIEQLERLEQRGASGSVAAVRDGEVVLCRGFGTADHQARTPATCDTVYDVMSMTKQFTAAAILTLETSGRLRLEDPVARYLSGVPADKQSITVHHLLTHTAGLPETIGGDYEPLGLRAWLDRAMTTPLRSRPGTRHHYSNVGYSLLAAVVQQASGDGYERYLADHLFAPAGMRQTGYVLPDWRRARIAVEYDASGHARGRPDEHPWAADGPFWNLRGNGGMLSTARDMAAWNLALDTGRILDPRATRRLFRPYVHEEPGGSTSAGYGWVVIPSRWGPIAWHNGGNGWSYGELMRVPSRDVSLFWITNQAASRSPGADLERASSRIIESLLRPLLA